MTDKGSKGAYRAQTKLVRGGLQRSRFDETSEAIYMSSGYVYPSAEEAAAAFQGEVDRFIYSRYANPTVGMFEERLCQLEGAAACRGTGSGMGAVFTALLSLTKAGDRVVASRALFGSCYFIVTNLLPRYGIETELVDGTDLSRVGAGAFQGDGGGFPRDALQPESRNRRSGSGLPFGPRGGGGSGGGQCLFHTPAAAAVRLRSRCGGLFRHQTH